MTLTTLMVVSMSERVIPEIISIKRQNGIAGQFRMDCKVRYPGEDEMTTSFVGNIYSESVVMILNGNQSFVDSPERFGSFSKKPKEWCLNFCNSSPVD